MGNTARVRALLEGERRWCGNKGETLTGAPVHMGRHEMLAMLLDKRTLGASHVSPEQRKEASEVFVEEYVNFYKNAQTWEIARLLAEKEKAIQAAKDAAKDAGVAVKVEEKGGGGASSAMASGSLFTTTAWSEDEDDEEDDNAAVVDVDIAAADEAKRVLKAWRKYAINWLEVYPELKEKKVADKTVGEPLDLTEDLMRLDIGKLYKEIARGDQGRRVYGYVPLMASCSKGQLGALSAESYCERVLSVANQVVVEGNTLLGDDEVEMITILRMNCAFMQFMRQHYSAEAKQAFNQSLATEG